MLERICLAEFPHLPSRLECVFFFENAVEAGHYNATVNSAKRMILYEVELANRRAPQHVADWKGTGPYDCDEWARRYWRGDIVPDRGQTPGPLCHEALAVTSLRVLREVE